MSELPTFQVVSVLFCKFRCPCNHLNKNLCELMLEQVTRGGRRLKVSIFEVVVGDMVQLNIGDQVRQPHCSAS